MDKKGTITVDNVLEMVNNLGIKVNVNEARVLVASADKNCSNDLTLDEFMDMIYHTNDALNVDLKKIAKIQSDDLKILDK